MENFNNLTPQMKKSEEHQQIGLNHKKSPSSNKNKQKLAMSQRKIYKWRFERTILFEVQTKKKSKNNKRRMNKRMKQKEEESHRFIHHFITSKIFTLNQSCSSGKVKIIWKEGQKHKKNQTKYISKIHQDGRSIEEFKKDGKRRRKLHNLCQPISNWKLIKWRQKPGKIGYFKLTTGNNL